MMYHEEIYRDLFGKKVDIKKYLKKIIIHLIHHIYSLNFKILFTKRVISL